MKKIFTKQNILPVVVLGTICLVVAALLGAVNMITAPVIEDAKNQAANEALLVVLPEGKTFDEIELTEDYPTEIKKAYKSDAGYVFEVNTRGKETMTVMCGVDNDGKIVKVTVLSEQETPGYKEKVLPFVTGDEGKYNGKGSDSLEPELFSGATLTSNGVYNAVKTSLNGYAVATGGEVAKPEYIAPVSQRTDDELLTLAGGLVADATGFTESKFDAEAYGVKYLAKVFKENSGKGYVAYVVVPLINEYYNKIETETLIYITNKGIIKDVNKLTWKPSDAGYGYVPPALELVDAFYESLKGKNISDLEALKAYDDNDDSTSHNGLLITQATQTTGRLLGALIEAVKSAESLDVESDDGVNTAESGNAPKIIGIVLISIAVIAMAACIIVPKFIRRRKNG